MAKIHTHYDNLKVSRKAPPEVIRAAYKALSQKYHPDKNPNDEKAARIMAVVNNAYNTLSNEQTRKEHDEWIAAEEWEIEWLENSKEEGKDKPEAKAEADTTSWSAVRTEETRPDRRRNRALTLLLMVFCGALGWLVAVAVLTQADWMPVVYRTLGIQQKQPSMAALADAAAKGAPAAAGPVAATTRVIALSQIRLPDFACTAPHDGLPAPGAGNWPAATGYLAGTRLGNQGTDTQLVIDNAKNAANVRVRLVDVVKKETVRDIFLLAHEKFTIPNLAAGNYEVRFEAVEMSPLDKADCEASKRAEAAQAPAPTPIP